MYQKSYQRYYSEQPPSERKANRKRPGQPAIAINGWDKLPNEFVEEILIQAIKSSNHVCEIYKNIINVPVLVPDSKLSKKGEIFASLNLYQSR